MTVLERTQLAAIFLAKWVDVGEEIGPRLDKRIAKALALADRLLLVAATPTEPPATPNVEART